MQSTALSSDWHQTHFLPIAKAAHILGVSRAQLYRLAGMGRVALHRSLGRVVLRTEDVIRLADSATPWKPEPGRNAAAMQALRDQRTQRSR
jgi:hypothetical protein